MEVQTNLEHLKQRVLLRLESDPLETTSLVAVLLAAAVAFGVYYYRWSTLSKIPSVGIPPGILGPWRAAFSFSSNGYAYQQSGFQQFHKLQKPFKLSTIPRYIVFVSSPQHIREIKEAPDDVLSFRAATSERIASEYTMHGSLDENPYHIKLVQRNLTERLQFILPDVMSEVKNSWESLTNIGDEFTELPVWDVLLQVIARTTNRMFVGVPLCREPEYLNNVIEYATHVVNTGFFLDEIPRIFRPIVAWYRLNKQKRLRTLLHFVGPTFKERIEMKKRLAAEGKEWVDKPGDAIQWIVDAAPPHETIEMMTWRLLLLNFAAIHTTSISLIQVIYELAGPEGLSYQATLREEIQSTVAASGGWTKQALTKMKKLDSVLRESQRLNTLGTTSNTRKALQDFQFSDGTKIPKGVWVVAAASSLHHSEELFENADVFDPWRWSRKREEAGNEAKFQMVSTSETYLPFGHGRHACPGRFFVANELKLIMAQIILDHEFRFADGGERPENQYFNMACTPDLSKKIVFRRWQNA